MLACVCSVIDHRWRQNVVRTKKWHTRRSRVCHWCSYHILTSSVIYYWIRRTATWNLFVLYNNEKPFFISKYFNITRKPDFLPRLCSAFAPPLPENKSHLKWSDLYKIKQFHWSLCVAKNCDWSRHCQTWLERRYSWNENLQRKQNWTAKSTNLEETAGKIEPVSVIRAALWAE